MDKYAVIIKQDKDKLASERDKCPICGADLDKEASVPRCPEHGVRPFEEEKSKDRKTG